MKLKSQFITKSSKERIYQSPVPLIAITGGIATGKSSVSKILKSKDLPVIDADQLVKKIYQDDQTIQFIKQRFPEVIKDDQINFPKLREIFFKNQDTKKEIEDFIYARLPATFNAELAKLKDKSFVFYDIPLLFEKNLQNLFDLTILVYAPASVQKDRLIKRDHIEANLALEIINQQIDIEKKRALANFIIENDKDEDLEPKVDLLLSQFFIND